MEKVLREIAKQLREDASGAKTDKEMVLSKKEVLRYAERIETAAESLKAAVPASPPSSRHCRRCMAPLGDLPGPHCVACQGDLEKRLKKATESEEDGVRTAVVLDGPMSEEGQSTSVSIPTDAVVGGPDINVGGHRYRLTVHGLRFVKPEATIVNREIVLGK